MTGLRCSPLARYSSGLPAGWFACPILLALTACSLAAAEDGPTGEEIYRAMCAECHGVQGGGVEGVYPDPLHGDRSLEELTKIIHDTMPDKHPEKCVGAAAERVAAYIYGTFYTAEARARNKPPRIELCRLTVGQYANAVADLVRQFVGEGKLDEQRGIKGTYYSARDFRGDKRAFERVDPQIDFDFGEGSPAADKIGNSEFSMQWQGGLIAEDTGDYEIVLRTENGARLWVNDQEKPLIDAWVKSGDDTEHRATVRLLGGRVYPVRLNYFKQPGKTASVALRWRPPRRAEQVVPPRNLSPNWFPPLLVVETPFPPDDSSVGYARGTSVSPSWDQATTYAAIEVANQVVSHLDALAKCPADAPDRQRRLQEFCYRFVERAFRRPLSDEQKKFFVDSRFDSAKDLDTAVKRVVLLGLKSPRFLYLGIGGEVDDYEVASRLSFGLWDSLPDEQLWQAAAAGKLRTPAEVAAQAERMLADQRARSKLRRFFHHWLQVDRVESISKDQELFPGFDDAIVSDLRTSLDLFLEDVAWGEADDFRRLLLTEQIYLNPRLAEFYGVETPSGDGFQKVSLDPAQRSGVLTHPYLLANFAYHKSSSPIHRGVFLVRSVLGRSLKPPPIAVTPLDEGLDPEMTTRERVALQTNPAACQTCHNMINPLGFTLENYDAVGRYRGEEKGKAIDASGWYVGLTGAKTEFHGARGLAEFLAGSEETRRSFVEQLFHHVVKQPVAAYGPQQLEDLENAFAAADYRIRRLLVEIVKTTALKTNPP